MGKRKKRAALFAAACGIGICFAGISSSGASFQDEEIRKGDVITFGRYEQDDVSLNGKEPIEWKILEIDEEKGEVLLISAACLDCRPYHVDPGDPGAAKEVTWEDSSIRRWLNNDMEGGFLGDAFSERDRERICESVVPADENGHFGDADAGAETEDRVFLLSEAEAMKYFSGRKERRASATAWAAAAQKKKPSEDEEVTEKDEEYWIDTTDTTGDSFWWLRTPGEDNTFAECVGAEGAIVQTGYLVNQQYFGVRPAIRVELD